MVICSQWYYRMPLHIVIDDESGPAVRSAHEEIPGSTEWKCTDYNPKPLLQHGGKGILIHQIILADMLPFVTNILPVPGLFVYLTYDWLLIVIIFYP